MGLLEKLEKSLLSRNYSNQTIKSYLFVVGKYLEFSKALGINQESAKKFPKLFLIFSQIK